MSNRDLSVGKEAKMSTAKEEVRKMLDMIPEDASFEDIQYHLYVQEKIERRMSKWLGR